MPARPEASATRALAWLYSRAAERALLAALCAIEREIGASLRPGLDHQVAHTRLAWWREECARCAQGQPTHPLTRALGASLPPQASGALAGLAGLVDTAQWDLARATFETRRELTAYCERWSAAMIEPLAGATAAVPAVAAPLRTLGRSLRELELLLALPTEAHAGRIRLPLDELGAAQATPAQLAQPPWPAALAALVRERHGQLRGALAASLTQLAPAARPLRGLMVWAALALSHSGRAARDLPRASLARDYHAALDGWRAWRAARGADAGRAPSD
jgi:15-cis-phytoene synthase